MMSIWKLKRYQLFLPLLLVLAYFIAHYELSAGSKGKKPKKYVNIDTEAPKECQYGPYTPNITDIAPNVDMYVRMYSGTLHYYDHFLVQSMQYFWPGSMSLVVVLDGENTIDRELGKVLPVKYPYPKVCYMEPIDSSIYHGSGHERMQRDYFYAERYVTKKYVGFLDTDTVFVTTVSKDLMFQNNKPVIIAQYGKPMNDFWAKMSKITELMLKTREVMRCMSYFPVIIKVQHIVELRKYLENLHGRSFDDLYKMFSQGGFPQFNIFCQYIWQFHREEYHFRFQYRPYDEEDYAMSHEFQKNINYYQNILTPDLTRPIARTSIHYRWHPTWKRNETLQRILKTGICFSGGFYICPDKCKLINRTSLHQELFLFEDTDWTWDQRCRDEQSRHYTNVQNWEVNTFKSIMEGCIETDNVTFIVKELK